MSERSFVNKKIPGAGESGIVFGFAPLFFEKIMAEISRNPSIFKLLTPYVSDVKKKIECRDIFCYKYSEYSIDRRCRRNQYGQQAVRQIALTIFHFSFLTSLTSTLTPGTRRI